MEIENDLELAGNCPGSITSLFSAQTIIRLAGKPIIRLAGIHMSLSHCQFDVILPGQRSDGPSKHAQQKRSPIVMEREHVALISRFSASMHDKDSVLALRLLSVLSAEWNATRLHPASTLLATTRLVVGKWCRFDRL